jgi:hypothetical protein
MNWFERYLNWSLILGLIYIPFNVSFTIGLIASIRASGQHGEVKNANLIG